MLRFAGTTLASTPLPARFMDCCAGLAVAACGARAVACASAPGVCSWVACEAQPHKMAARANTVFFMLLSLVLVGKDPLWRKLYLRKYVTRRPRGTIRR